jgi:hypothetical protein
LRPLPRLPPVPALRLIARGIVTWMPCCGGTAAGAVVDKGTGSVGRGNVAADHLHLWIAWPVARFAVSAHKAPSNSKPIDRMVWPLIKHSRQLGYPKATQVIIVTLAGLYSGRHGAQLTPMCQLRGRG